MFEKEERRLEAAMREVAAELEEEAAPSEIEWAVLAEFDRVQRRRRGRYWIGASGAVAASVVLIWMAVHRPASLPAAPVIEAEAEQPFMPIPYVLPPAPYERIQVVRMKLPVAALIAAGLPMRTADPGAQAEADVIVGQDGRPRAVRLVSISFFN
jgi:hypothetical protein